MVNASLFLRRPLLVTGKPGSGKSALATELPGIALGRVLRWSVTSRTALQSGQYEYDAIGRAQAAATSYAAARRAETNGKTDIEEPAIGDFIRLGPLGTAFLPTRTPRVLLIDELDKSDADLPDDLLSIFEDAEFGIPELERIRAHTPTVRVFTSDRNGNATLTDGRVACAAFPVIIITSNGEGERRDYLRYLGQTRRKVRAAVVDQQRALAWRHPEPAALWSLVGSTRLWERRPQDEDFGEVRVAVGEQKLGLRLTPMATSPVEDLEPLAAHALRSFIRAYATVPEQPIAIYLRAWARVLFRGDEEQIRSVARAMVAQLVTFHAPDDVWVALCVSDERRPDWEWAKWLPHHICHLKQLKSNQKRTSLASALKSMSKG